MGVGKGINYVSYPDWNEFVRAYALVDDDLTQRDATLCFVWSRMRFIDVEKRASHMRWAPEPHTTLGSPCIPVHAVPRAPLRPAASCVPQVDAPLL